MVNVQTLVDLKNKQAFDMCKGDAKCLAVLGTDPYTIVDGKWYFKGKLVDDKQQIVYTDSIAFELAKLVLQQSVA